MEYYTILTDAGRALETAALAGKVSYTLATCALGDGGNMPDPTRTALQNEVWRGPINSIAPDANNPTWLVIETRVPPEDGGFTIREFGIYTDEGVLFAIGNYPELYKPTLAEGTGIDLVVSPICQVSNATSVTLLTDTSIMMATKKYVDDQIKSAVPLTRTISTTAPLTGGGALSNNLSLKVNNASETAVGVVQLASVTEASAGTITSKAVTPAGLSRAAVPLTRTISTTAPLTGGGALSSNLSLKVNNASETAVGVVQLATDAEAIAGTVATKAITPKQLGISRRNIGEVFHYQGRSAPFGAVVADGGLVRREMYPDLWTFAQAQNLVVTEAAWQTQAGTQGAVGLYSAGDGVSTFRLPLMTDYFRGTVDPAKVGTWQGDAIRNITGTFYGSTGNGGGKALGGDGSLFAEYRSGNAGSMTYTAVTTSYQYSYIKMNAAGVVPTAQENRPKTLFLLPCIQAYNSVIPNAQADMHGYLNALNDKVDKVAWQTLVTDKAWKLPSGLILQLFTTSSNLPANSDTAITAVFPVAFPNKCLQVLTDLQSSAPRTFSTSWHTLSNANVKLYYGNNGSLAMTGAVVSIMAIGM